MKKYPKQFKLCDMTVDFIPFYGIDRLGYIRFESKNGEYAGYISEEYLRDRKNMIKLRDALNILIKRKRKSK